MANVIKLHQGLDIKLKGAARTPVLKMPIHGEYALIPEGFVGITPKVVVQEGDYVKVGDPLFVNKFCPDVKFSTPVSGKVTAIERGERRKLLCVKVKAEDDQHYQVFEKLNVKEANATQVINSLLNAGIFGFINQLPYAVSTSPTTLPKAIFVSAFRDMPLSTDFEVELVGNEQAFQTGLTALSCIAKTHLGISPKQKSPTLLNAKDVEVTIYEGPCPAGNVGVHVNHVNPVNKGEIVWTVDPSAVIFFGRLFLTGIVDLTRTIAVAGSMIKSPTYIQTPIGTPISSILENRLKETSHIRIINGNPLTGIKSTLNDFLSPKSSEISVIPEGDNVNEILGWIMPRFKQFSNSRTYFSWLQKNKEYNLDARIKGGKRHMIMSGEYDRVIPINIYAEYLIKAILTEDIDRQEQLGIYEVSPEDFAVAEFVDSSKLELQKIVREGLNILRKENA